MSQSSPASTPSEDAPAATAESGPLKIDARIEAALMVTDKPLTSGRLSEAIGGAATKQIKQAIGELNDQYEQTHRSFRIEQVADGWQILTLPCYAEVVAGIRKTRAVTKLGPAAMETLAIVAYKQPVLRAHVEEIRGVMCGEVLRGLMERKLVRIVGRAEELGRPMLYGTTTKFLELFGLANLKDLPPVDQFQPRPRAVEQAAEQASEETPAQSSPEAGSS